MGGTALSIIASRLTRENYFPLVGQVVATLRELYPNGRIAAIPAYRTKPDYGDLDVLVEAADYDPFMAADVLGAVELVRNGPVTSLGLTIRPGLGPLPGNVFQVDLIRADPGTYDYALGYFAYTH